MFCSFYLMFLLSSGLKGASVQNFVPFHVWNDNKVFESEYRIFVTYSNRTSA